MNLDKATRCPHETGHRDFDSGSLGFGVGGLAAVVGALIIGASLDACGAHHELREEAIESGVAEWYIDSDGDKKFRWLQEREKGE